MTEYWGFGRSEPGRVAGLAAADEADGWDGLVYVDSQNLRMDVFVTMASALAATTRLKVSPGVTNPVTRHPAVAASAIAALSAEFGGRASYGIGRGDSALAYIGLAPCSMATFDRYVRNVQAYLSRERVPFDQLEAVGKTIDTLELGDEPEESWLRWLTDDVPKPPVEVVATGPKAIGVGGRHADLVTFTVGADDERLRWGIETARAAAAEAGRDPDELRFGAYLNVVAHPDLEVARRLVAGGLASFSRFAAMHGSTTGPVSGGDAAVLKGIRDRYDMTRHGEPESSQTEVLTPEFIDRFGVVGDASRVTEHIAEIVDLGFERLVLMTPNQATRERYPEDCADAHRYLVSEVLPGLPGR